MIAWLAVAMGAETPQQALQEAAAAEDPASAVRLLLPWVQQYPEDYQLVLELAWRFYQAGQPEEALAYYRRAAALSGGGWLPRVGEAWCLVELAPSRARALVDELEAERPDASELPALRSALPARPYWGLGVSLGAERYTSSQAVDGATGLRVVVRRTGPWWVDATIGGAWVVGNDTTPSFASYEGWLRTGVSLGTVRLIAAGAAFHDGVTLGGAAGGRVGWEKGPVGLGLEGAWTRPLFEPLDVVRVAPTLGVRWRSLVVQPGGALQWIDGAFWPSGSLTLGVSRDRWALWVGGRVGTETASTELTTPYTVRWPEPVHGMGFATVRVGRVDRTWASLTLSGNGVAGGVVPGAMLRIETAVGRRPR